MKPSHSSHEVVNILGVQVSTLTVVQLHEHIAEIIHDERQALVLHANVHCLNLAWKHTWLHQFLNTADTVFCDGYGVLLAAHLLGSKIPQRITYAEWMWQLAYFSISRDFSFYFLGARPGTAKKAALQLRKQFPTLRIAGVHHGYFNKSRNHPENEAVIREINALQPHLLIVGFGMPLQERWLMENWDRLSVNVALTGGAVFDYVSGELRRAPRWMGDHGLEWLGRLIIEPRRLWKRYLIGNPLFLWRVLKQRFGLSRFENE